MKLFQSGGQSCMRKEKSIAIVLKTSVSNWLVENQPWRSERQWAAMKSSFESQPDIKLAFLCAGRERKWGDPTEERWGGRAESQHLACSRSTCRGEPQREQETDHSHTNTRAWTSEGPEIKCRDHLYTLIQLQRRRARTDKHIEQVIRQLTAKVGEAAAQKSARQQLMLPMWSFNREREWRRLENSSISERTERETDPCHRHSSSAHSQYTPVICCTCGVRVVCVCVCVRVCKHLCLPRRFPRSILKWSLLKPALIPKCVHRLCVAPEKEDE